MRILRLDLEGEELDLHPYVTMLGGLAPGDRQRVVDRLIRIARGDATGGPGLVESKNVLSEVSPEVLAALSLDPSLDVVVRPEQLPGARVQAAQAPNGATAADGARAELVRVENELVAAREVVATATQALDAARRGLDDYAITAHDSSVATLSAAEDAARARIAATPAADERSALVARFETARRDAQAHEVELQSEREALLELLEALDSERQRLDELQARRDAGHNSKDDPTPAVPTDDQVMSVRTALDAVRAGPPPAERVPSPKATDLADRIAAHERRHDDLESALRAEGVDVVALQDQLALAKVEAREAEEAARPKVVSPEDDAEIERLHDIVVEQSEKKNSRRGGKGAERAYEEAGESLDVILEKVGFPTYAAYVMGRLAPSVDPDAKRRHDACLARVDAAERQLDEAAAVLERDSRVLMLRAERDQLWAEARDTLGTLPDDVETALREMRVDAPVEFTAVDDLADVLQSVGIPSPSADEVAVVATAETYLADAAIARAAAETPRGGDVDPLELEIRESKRRLADLHAKATEGDATLAEWEAEAERLNQLASSAETALAEHDATSPSPDDDAEARLASDPAVAQAREMAAQTAARLSRHRAAVEQVDDRHAELRAARSAERDAEARRDAAAASVAQGAEDAVDHADTEVVWELDGDDVEPLEWYLLGRVAGLRQVSHTGSVPLILDDAFRGLPESACRALCQALSRIGQSVQVIYVGDAPGVAAWASEQGLDHAAVVRPGQPAI